MPGRGALSARAPPGLAHPCEPTKTSCNTQLSARCRGSRKFVNASAGFLGQEGRDLLDG